MLSSLCNGTLSVCAAPQFLLGLPDLPGLQRSSMALPSDPELCVCTTPSLLQQLPSLCCAVEPVQGTGSAASPWSSIQSAPRASSEAVRLLPLCRADPQLGFHIPALCVSRVPWAGNCQQSFISKGECSGLIPSGLAPGDVSSVD